MKITNNTGINLPLAVWLLHDEYDYINEPNYISVTSLMKPLKQIILSSREPSQERQGDIVDNVSRALGHAIHDSIEKSWTRGHARAMKKLGYPDDVIDKIIINPSDGDDLTDRIPIWLEKRSFKKVLVGGTNYTIGGKFDMVADGELYDNKSTSAFTWLFGTKDEDHQLQGSLYRWLNPDIVLGDHIHINYIFTDWSRMQARSNPKYPQKRVEEKHIPLLSIKETEQWVQHRLRELATHWNSPEERIPQCSDKELWMSDPTYKYYADKNKLSGRSTKNFDNKHDADSFMASRGGSGVVITVKGEAKACNYCPVFDICQQKDLYL